MKESFQKRTLTLDIQTRSISSSYQSGVKWFIFYSKPGWRSHKLLCKGIGVTNLLSRSPNTMRTARAGPTYVAHINQALNSTKSLKVSNLAAPMALIAHVQVVPSTDCPHTSSRHFNSFPLYRLEHVNAFVLFFSSSTTLCTVLIVIISDTVL